MAKSQKHSNRETRKPKAVKAAVVAAPATFLTRGASAPIPSPSKKK